MKTRSYLFLMLVAIILPVACLSILGLSMLLESERESRLHTIEEKARSTSLLIDGEIANAESALRTVAWSDDIAADNFARLHRLLSATRTSPLSWTAIGDYDGNGLMNTLKPYGAPLAKRTGSWAARAYDAGRTTVQGYFIGALSKRGVVSVTVPVPPASGKKYVVTQIFDSKYFNKIFDRNRLDDGWIVKVFDANGVIISRNHNADRFIGIKVIPPVLEASRRQHSGMVRHLTRDGIDVYDIFVRSERSDWTVAIGVPVAEIESPARLTTWYAAAALLLVLGAAVAIAVFVGRRIDRSLGNATLAAHALGQGKITPAFRSQLKEADMLLDVLHRTSVALADESAARLALEAERERLLESERAARRQAEAQSDAKDNFISMLSHELRNPLAAVTGAVSVIRLPRMDPEKTDKAWDIVVRQLRHLTRMVDDLLDVRRVLSGKVTLDKVPVNVGAVLRFCCDSRSVATAMAGKHRWDIDVTDAWVVGDKTRLEQVIDNLLVNAMKFTPAGGTIAVRNRVQDGAIVIEVADSGVGIAPDVLPTIFESLVQGPTTIDRAQGGLGLGLSIARGLVQMHGGSITAHSDGLGKGCTVVVTLPCEPDLCAQAIEH